MLRNCVMGVRYVESWVVGSGEGNVERGIEY